MFRKRTQETEVEATATDSASGDQKVDQTIQRFKELFMHEKEATKILFEEFNEKLKIVEVKVNLMSNKLLSN